MLIHDKLSLNNTRTDYLCHQSTNVRLRQKIPQQQEEIMLNGEIARLEESSTEIRKSSTTTREPLTLIEMLQSTLWAVLGVQKPENQLRDFSRGNPWHFIYMGLGFTIFLVCLLTGIVHLALRAVYLKGY